MTLQKTGERTILGDFKTKEEYLIYLRHQFAYNVVAKNLKPGDIVLDLGCGEGYGSSYLAKNSVTSIVALDVDADTISHAKKKYKVKNLRFRTYAGKKIPFADKVFDVVVSHQVIEHVPDVNLYLSEIYRVLKKKGLFIVSTPNKVLRLKEKEKPFNIYHLREYSKTQLHALLKHYFKRVDSFGVNATQEIYQIEKQRIEKIKKISKLDPLQIRKYLPQNILMKVLKATRKYTNSDSPEKSFINKYFIEDFYLAKNHERKSLELLSLAQKD